MSVLNDNYKRIMTELEEKISNPEQLEFVKEKFIELSTMFIEAIDNFAEKTDEKISELEKKQQFIEEKISQVESAVDEIETDIYDEEDEEDGSYEFEIVCPYCNHEFTAEIAGENEVTCPECNNTIELDWNEDDDQQYANGCGEGCSTCGGCASGFETQDFDEDNEDDM